MRAPEFSVTDLSGNKLDLATYRGKVVLLDFWATWCAPCRAEIPRLVDLQNRYRNRGLRIIGISLDDDAKPVRLFYEQFKIDYPVAIGDAHLAERYGGILGLPVSLLIGCDGRIYVKHTGETDVSLMEQEIRLLLERRGCMQTSIGN
jgi:thiol-disulfide isomerase/thioredoxin